MAKINLDEIEGSGKRKKDGPRVFYFNFKEGEQGYDKLCNVEAKNKRPKDVVAHLLEKFIE
jgi:hypothetical protein